MRILLIEDEEKMSSYLRKGLSEASFTVDIAYNGEHGLLLAIHEDFDLIILDVGLPEMDGFEVLERVREEKDTPIIILSARDETQSKVKGFELGADDYLAKPFAYVELLARIRSLLRRAPRSTGSLLCVADLEIELLSRQVKRGGVPIDLTAQEFSLLHLLAERQGEVLTRTFITSQIWDINFNSETNVVDVAVRRLRAKIDGPFRKKLLHTVRGMGYVFEDKTPATE
ncbi:two-component regulatory system response regulator protein [Burkholderia sp. SJ98]|nr:two-component regulatory system response regulator protein [Burkholderia sp. SJ98]